jgi:hypothetical protein
LHDKIQVAVVGLKVAARRRAKQIQPPDLVLAAQVGDALFPLFDERNHTATISQKDKPMQLADGLANIHAVNAASQSFQTGS